MDHSHKKKILLFGRTGSGKSTVANMLVRGHLNPPLLFQTSSGVRGKTLAFHREESEDIVVVDTVGFGESENGSVTDAEAMNKLYDFFTKINDERYNFLAFVFKWGKLDELDARLWNFFKQAFSGASQNYVIIFTHCSPQALTENLEDIKVAFDGCKRYITVDFPAPSDRPEAAASARSRRNDKLRESSLKRLRELLDAFMMPSTVPCLRSTMMKGRVLVMGSSRNARNVIAKLLVDGRVNMASMSCIESDLSTIDKFDTLRTKVDKSFGYDELEGRGWQVVSLSALDSESLVDVLGWVRYNPEKDVLTDMLASKLNSVLHHGTYSHVIYVKDCEHVHVYGDLPRGIMGMLQQLGIRHSIVVVVNGKEDDPYKDAEKYKEWGIVCRFQLPTFCESPYMERENEVVQRHGLSTLEGALSATPACFNSESSPRTQYPPTLVGKMNNDSFNALVQTFKAFNRVQYKTGMCKSTNAECLYLWSNINATVFRMPFKHIVAELQYKPLNANALVRGLHILVSKAGSEPLIPTDASKVACMAGSEPSIPISESQVACLWGEIQILDKYHIDRKFARLPLFATNRKYIEKHVEDFVELTRVELTQNPSDICLLQCIEDSDFRNLEDSDFRNLEDIDFRILEDYDLEDVRTRSSNETEFVKNISYGDYIVLWMYPQICEPRYKYCYYLTVHLNVYKFDIQFGWRSQPIAM